jgi:UDP-GlcNAc:undecaprenyl-phosphate/decaprenyl-phosphate GlcNAc-1-phosphate transferase
MLSSLAAFVLAVLVTALLTPLVRRVALAVGAVDEPGARRVHTRRVPRLGGIAIVIGFFVPGVILFALGTHAARIFVSSSHITLGLVCGGALVASVGLWDDVKGMGAKRKLLMQMAAGTVAYACHMRIETIELPGLGVQSLGWLSLPVTVAWIVATINALNLIDGLDGLAAGVTFFACVTNFCIAWLTGNFYIELVSASLGGAVVGFLFYNFNPAQIFMGDSGSMFLGFVLGSAALLGAGSQKSPTLIAIIVPILALGLPIMDMLLTVARRFLERRSIFVADRGHIHHRLLDMGLTHRRTVLWLYLLSVFFTAVALVTYLGRSWQIGAALFALTVVLVGVIRFVGYFGSSFAGVGGLAAAALAADGPEALRKAVPRALARMTATEPPDQLPTLLADFAAAAGLLAVRIVNPNNNRLKQWGWEALPQDGERREAACASFEVPDDRGLLQLQFFVDSPTGKVGPKTYVLLQLVADAASAMLTANREHPRAATPVATPVREGRLA